MKIVTIFQLWAHEPLVKRIPDMCEEGTAHSTINTLMSGQNGHNFADDIIAICFGMGAILLS